jgi:hypothetical protein
VALDRYAAELGDTAAQSPLTHVTYEPAAAVVTVVDGAPVPVFVAFVAGVAASCAPVHRSNTAECHNDPPDADANVIVTVPGEPATTAVQIATWQLLAAADDACNVNVCPAAVGVENADGVVSIAAFTTSTSPVVTVIAVETNEVVFDPVLLTF